MAGDNLDQIEKGFKAGKNKDQVLADFKKPDQNKSMENRANIKSYVLHCVSD
jgi:hypothetical protein